MDVGAALITTGRKNILDNIDRVEKDYHLPLGVQSRRDPAYNYSYYEMRGLTLENIDEHIAYAKKGGFRIMVIYWWDFAESCGHFIWKKEYPNGLDDLKLIADKIRSAGIIPGFHIHYNKATKNDPYVTPTPDTRLNLTGIFTLKESVGPTETEIVIEENPRMCTMEDGRRILKLGDELIEYENYTTTPPYKFTGCKRGILNTTSQYAKKGLKIGLLDVDTWPLFIRFDQRTDIQQEVAERLAKIINETGVRFVYFDGAEDVHPPYWYYGSKAQLDLYNLLNPKPLVSEGAFKTHFSWHVLTRANAYDLFKPEQLREGVRKYMLPGAKYMAESFTAINFGWNLYSVDMQPDMYEYVCSRGAGWNAPISLGVVRIEQLRTHPRTEDNLEVMKNWEEARIAGFFTEEQKNSLKDPYQEHILIKNEKGVFELFPYQKTDIAGNSADVTAYTFQRNYQTWVIYWHTKGNAQIQIPVKAEQVALFDKTGVRTELKQNSKEYSTFPVDNRRFLVFDLPEQEVNNLLAKSKII